MAQLTENAQILHKKRYSHNGESWDQTCARVATAVTDDRQWQTKYCELMQNLKFLPNSPTLMNAGLNGTLSACFVLQPDDSLDSIFDIGDVAMRVLKWGGGVGYGLSRLRPAGSPVASTGGRARGPVAAMGYYQSIAAFVEQAGKRDGAQMAILSCDHPDLHEFIHLKNDDPQKYNTFNISIAATNEWMEKQITGAGGARLRNIVTSAWNTGDPGLFFIDRAEKDNPTPHLGKLECTNPCGEVPLLPFEACNLGSFNLAKYWNGTIVSETSGELNPIYSAFNGAAFKRDITTAVRFLDDIIDSNQFPDKRITESVQRTRKIGIGVMGWADLLALAEIPYNSDVAVSLGKSISESLRTIADEASFALGEERGMYPAWDKSYRIHHRYRNATRLCIAPTGSIAILAGCSSGIEPHFALQYRRTMGDGTSFLVNEPVIEVLQARTTEVPFQPHTTNEIHWSWHVQHQAAWQKHVDLAVSKTINLPNDATKSDILGAYKMAWETGCKGITVFRDGCREGGEQVLTVPPLERRRQKEDNLERTFVGFSDEPNPEENGGLYIWECCGVPRSGGHRGTCRNSMMNSAELPKRCECHSTPNPECGACQLVYPQPIVLDHRERLPRTRNSITHKFDIQGEECYLTIGLYDDGRPGEIFLTLHREGSATRAWADLCATFMSMLLQHGTTIEQLTKKLRLTRFEPSGMTGNPEIPQATSVPDYVGHFLELKFLGKAAPPIEPLTEEVRSGDTCPECGNLLVHQSGCTSCPACGWERC